MKKTLKYTFLALLFVTILAIPFFGIRFKDAGYNKDTKAWTSSWVTLVRSITDRDAVVSNLKLGGGSSVYLKYASSDNTVNSEENLKKGAQVLEGRLRDAMYADAKATVENGMIRVDVPQKSQLDSTFLEFAQVGKWSFKGSDNSTVLCDASYVKDAYVSANPEGGYSVTLEFNEKGTKEFYTNVSTYAYSGAKINFDLDCGRYSYYSPLYQAEVNESADKKTYTFGQFEYSDATYFCSFIKNGELPATVKVSDVKELPPTLGPALLTVVIVAISAILAACIVAFFIFGKKAGIFATLALLTDIAVFLIGFLSASYQLNFVNLITMVVLLIFASAFYIAAIRPVGKSLKEKSGITFSAMEKLSKFNTKSLWIHALLLILALTCYMFAQGVFGFIVRITMLFAFVNVVAYFLFFYFGIRTMADHENK